MIIMLCVKQSHSQSVSAVVTPAFGAHVRSHLLSTLKEWSLHMRRHGTITCQHASWHFRYALERTLVMEEHLMKTADNQQSEFNVRPIRQNLVHALFAGARASTRDESRNIAVLSNSPDHYNPSWLTGLKAPADILTRGTDSIHTRTLARARAHTHTHIHTHTHT